MIKTLKIGNYEIGDGRPVFITMEAGPTHNGLDSALDLLSSAADAGANAVKFQKVDPDRDCPDKSVMFEYEVLVDQGTEKTETVSEPLYDILARRYLSEDDFHKLASAAYNRGIEIFATATFVEDIAFFKKLDFDTVKIGSSNLTNLPLVKAAARSNMLVQVDTGMSQFSDIEKTIDYFVSEGGTDFIIHNCPSGYPAKLPSINLRMLSSLKQLFGMPVAFSDHTQGHVMDVAAISMGANLIEKTITHDRCTRSVEHLMSIEKKDLKSFVKTIREVEIAFGSTRRILHDDEISQKNRTRRSVFLKNNLPKGSYVSDDDIEMKTDPTGMSFDSFNELRRFPLSHKCDASSKLTYHDFEL